MTAADRLSSYLDALRPIIYINNFDFAAVDDLVAKVAEGVAPVEEFNNAQGRVNFKTKVTVEEFAGRLLSREESSGVQKLRNFLDRFITDTKLRRILVLKDVHEEIKASEVIAQLKAIAHGTMHTDGYWVPVIIVSSRLEFPDELEKLITVFDLDYPSREQIRELLSDYARDFRFELLDQDMDVLSLAFKGLSEFEIRQILNLAYQQSGKVSLDDLGLILKEKERAIRKSGLLEAVPVSDSTLEVGGLENLVEYIRQKSVIYQDLAESIAFGVDIPKGILIVGMPGCGKSLTAKTCARLFNVPLLRLDVGRLLGKYVGESEENLRRAIKLAEAATPCVLWIDELEKAFAGVGADSSGGGVTTRLFGYFLTWMQEKDSTVYVVATANDISTIPPEFLRKGRFDEIFSVGLPNEEERKRIFEIHLKKRKKDWRKLGLRINELVKQTAGKSSDEPSFSGADIESIVKAGIESAFARKLKMRKVGDASNWEDVDLEQRDLVEAIKNTKPIRETMAEKIGKLQVGLKKFQIVSASAGYYADVARESSKRSTLGGKPSVSATAVSDVYLKEFREN